MNNKLGGLNQTVFGGLDDSDELFRKHKIYKWIMIGLIITQIVWIIIILVVSANTVSSVANSHNLTSMNDITSDWFKWITAISFLNFIFLIFAIWKKAKYKRKIKRKYGKDALKRKGKTKFTYDSKDGTKGNKQKFE